MLKPHCIIEELFGRKWCVSILQAISDGIIRPGAIERHLAGISTKVLTDRLNNMVILHLVEKTKYPELPPRTEYHLTPFGARTVNIISQLQQCYKEFDEKRSKKRS